MHLCSSNHDESLIKKHPFSAKIQRFFEVEPDLHRWIPFLRPRTVHPGDLQELREQYRAPVDARTSRRVRPERVLLRIKGHTPVAFRRTGIGAVVRCFRFGDAMAAGHGCKSARTVAGPVPFDARAFHHPWWANNLFNPGACKGCCVRAAVSKPRFPWTWSILLHFRQSPQVRIRLTNVFLHLVLKKRSTWSILPFHFDPLEPQICREHRSTGAATEGSWW